jgi:hypothetical protein
VEQKFKMSFLEPYVLYEVPIATLTLKLTSGETYDFPETLSNGRANYILFEELIRSLTGLHKTTKSDHVSTEGLRYEQKAYFDVVKFPGLDHDLFQTSASSTFGANNNGPRIKKLLENSEYEEALRICSDTGYFKNDFYIYTNTRGFSPDIPFRYVVVPKTEVLNSLDSKDPRLISRTSFLSKVVRVVSR